jgi:hypothetical protein
MVWNVERLDKQLFLGSSEDAPRAHRRHAARAGFPFVLGIGIDDLDALRVVEVPHVIDRHGDDMAVGRWLHEITLHHRGDRSDLWKVY